MKYKQIYTSSIFNIKNKIDISKNTVFINVFTNEDYNLLIKIKNKIIIYNSELHFFNYLEIVKKVILLDIPIYCDNIKIKKYLFDNGKLSELIINIKEARMKVIEEERNKVIEEEERNKVIEEEQRKKVISSIFLFVNDNTLLYI